MNKNGAFTLAEVLITLGIIGVVAALTMPSLIANYRKQVYVNQLKKSVVTLENAMRKILADSGTDYLENSEFSHVTASDKTSFLNKYINIVQSGDKYDTDINYIAAEGDSSNLNDYIKNRPYFITSDGAIFYYSIDATEDGIKDFATNNLMNGTSPESCTIMYPNQKRYCYIAGDVIIDVNGRKLPNQLGKDVFFLNINHDGAILPLGGSQIRHLSGVSWDANSKGCVKTAHNWFGDTCAGQVIDSGWKMDY